MLKVLGIAKFIIRPISLYVNTMNYATGYAFNAKELFSNFKVEKLKTSTNACKKILGYVDRKTLAIRIFLYAVKVILLDIIDNNITFKFPTKRECFLNIVGLFGEDFKKAYRNGKFQEIDYLASDFSGYYMQFMYIANGREIKKKVHINKELKDRITKNTNEGKIYY